MKLGGDNRLILLIGIFVGFALYMLFDSIWHADAYFRNRSGGSLSYQGSYDGD